VNGVEADPSHHGIPHPDPRQGGSGDAWRGAAQGVSAGPENEDQDDGGVEHLRCTESLRVHAGTHCKLYARSARKKRRLGRDEKGYRWRRIYSESKRLA
jgi:hypothetical protein